MIVLHYLEDSRAQRILWLLEEAGAPYEVELYRRNPKTRLAPPELAKVHPLGKSPVITDGDVTVAESAAIIEYIAELHAPELVPSDPEVARECRYWMHYAEGTLMPGLVMRTVFGVASSKVPKLLHPILMAVPNAIRKSYMGPLIKKNLEFVESHLSAREWFAGDAFSIADIQMSFPLEAIAKEMPGRYPGIERFVRRIHAREAYARGLAAVDVEYRYA